MHIVRILSNNAVVAAADGNEVVALGSGIGFRHKKGGELPEGEIERVFYPTPAQPMEQLSAFLAELPATYLDAALEICDAANRELSIPPSQATVIAIADHLSFAIHRQQKSLAIEFPLASEIAQLYPAYAAAGRNALGIVENRLGVRLPEGESVSFAMHFINAQAGAAPSSLPWTRQLALVSQIFDVIDSSFDVTVDRGSMNASRFVTHLRYVFARIDRHTQLEDTPNEITHAIAANFSEAMACARRVAYLISVGLDTEISADEVAFIAIHVARLVEDRNGAFPPLSVHE